MTTEVKTTDTKTAAQSSSAMALALKTIGFDSAALQSAADVLADGEVLKSTSSLSAQALSHGELVHDRWTEGRTHSVPTREEIRTGPPQASSGAGAERMVREYSHPAPQDGLTMQAERLAEEIGSLRGFMRSMNDSFSTLAKHQEATTTILSALLGNMAVGKGEFTVTDELTKFAEQCAGKSQKFLDAARSHLAKAIALKSDAGELTGDARAIRKSEIKVLRANAAKLIVKAQEAAYAACSGGNDTTVEIRKAIDTIIEGDPILKAKTSEEREKMREKDEKACAKKALKKSLKRMVKKAAAKAAAKAAVVAPAAEAIKNNQADEQDKDTKNQDDKSVSTKAELSPETEAMIKKTLDGTAMLQGTVQDLMSLLNGRAITKNASAPLTLVKSDNSEPLLDQLGRVEKAISGGILNDSEAMRARDLAGKFTAVEQGAMSKSIWASLVMKSTPAVVALFPEASAA